VAAIWGVGALYALLSERDKIKVPFSGEVTFKPMLVFLGFVGLEIWAIAKGRRKNADHASHIGGMLTGVAVAGFMKYRGFKGNDGSEPIDLVGMAKEGAGEVKLGMRRAVGKGEQEEKK
jgi:rhomboid-like protein